MTILKPVFAVGLLAAAWHQERGGVPQLSDLFRVFARTCGRCSSIGVFFVAGIYVAVYASSIVDGGRLLEFVATGGSLTEEQLAARLADPRAHARHARLGAACAAGGRRDLVGARAGRVPGRERARRPGREPARGLANWKALAVYGVAVFFYGGVVPAFVFALIALVASGQALSLMVVALLLPYSLFFASTLHISDYVSYRDVFHANETLAPLSRGGS